MVDDGQFTPSESAPLIYPAPAASPSGDTSPEFIAQILEDGTPAQRFAGHFQLGNSSLRRADYLQAMASYQRAMKIDDSSPELRTNFAVVSIALERFSDADTHLRRALMLNKELDLPHFHLGRLAAAQNNSAAAKEHFDRYLEKNPLHVPTRLALARIASSENDRGALRRALIDVLRIAPDQPEAQTELVKLEFDTGKALFDSEAFTDAVRTWSQIYRKYPRPFSAHPLLANELRLLVQRFNQAGEFDKALDAFRTQFKADPDNKEVFYRLFLSYVFSIGLIPEGFEDFHSLTAEEQRWKESLAERGEHPYPHFRLALLAHYRGDVEKAFDELTICRDKLPPKKQAVLKIKELFQFVDLIREIERKGDEFRNINLPDFEWEQAGFRDPFSLRAWRESGLSPQAAAAWLEAGFSPTKAATWHEVRIEPVVARVWNDAGFDDPLEVRNWIRGQFDPASAKRWKNFQEQGESLPFDTLLQYKRAGFDDPSSVYRWARVLKVPFEAAAWADLGFEPEEVSLWRTYGFTDPHDAFQRKQRGMTAEEALRNFNNPESAEHNGRNENSDPDGGSADESDGEQEREVDLGEAARLKQDEP